MSDYKVIFRDEQPPWQLGCPVLIETIQVSRNIKTAQCFLQLKLKNVSAAEVHKLSLSARVEAAGQEEHTAIELLDADITPGASITPKAIALTLSQVNSVKASLTSVDDNATWGEASPQPRPEASELTLSAKALEERRKRLKEAQVASHLNGLKEEDGWWVCGCGQINVDTSACISCGASLNLLQSLENEADLERWADERKQVEDERKQAEDDKKRKRNKTLRIAIPVAVAATLIAAWLLVWRPKMEYDSALQFYEEKRYTEAYEKLSSLGDYKDAPIWAAQSLMKEGDLTEALKVIEGMDDSDEKTTQLLNQALSDMASYIQKHPTTEDQKTEAYLNLLTQHNYKDWNVLLGLVSTWSYKFSLTSKNAFEQTGDFWGGNRWTDVHELSGKYDDACLLIRAACTKPKGMRVLHINWETLSADTWQSEGSGSIGMNDFDWKIESDELQDFYYYNLNCDAFRVTVTDTATGEILFQDEIYKSSE